MTREPIAIVGLGGVLPGAPTLDDFWQVVEGGIDTASEPRPTAGRWISSSPTTPTMHGPTESTRVAPASFGTSGSTRPDWTCRPT